MTQCRGSAAKMWTEDNSSFAYPDFIGEILQIFNGHTEMRMAEIVGGATHLQISQLK